MHIAIYRDRARGLIRLVSNKVTADQIYAAAWKTYQCCEFLIKAIRNRFKGENTLSQNYSSRIDAEDGVHVPRNVKLLKRLHTCFRSILDILLGLLEFFGELDT